MIMKKTIFIALLLTAVTTASWAQFSNGTFLIGGTSNLSIGFDTNKSKSGSSTTTDGKTTSFSLEPAVGYFFMDNLAVGAGLNLSTSTFKADGSGNKSISSSTLFTPFVRYYFDKFYAQGAFQVGSEKTEIKISSTTTTFKDGVTGWSLAGGYALMLNESVALEPQIGFRSTTFKNKDSDNKDITSGLFIRMGVFVYLAR
jgi:long-subunit fatty acid transport protein